MTLAVALLALAAAPDLPKPGTPVRVDAAEVHYAFQKREVVFTGKPVTLTREDARLTCERLVAKNDAAGKIVTAVCQGDVKLVRGERTVTCDAATYEDAAARVTCEGHTVLRDGGAEGRGERLVYELRTDEVRFSARDGERVLFTIPGAQVEQKQREYEERRRARREARP